MAAKKNVQAKFSIPSSFNATEREVLGLKIIDEIVTRSKKGIASDGSKFPKYSKEYKASLDFQNAGKGSKVDLTLSGDMLASMEIIEHSSGSITVGYDVDDNMAGQVEGNQTGSYGRPSGNSSKARHFIGLPSKALSLIVAEVRAELPEQASGTQSIVSRLLGGN